MLLSYFCFFIFFFFFNDKATTEIYTLSLHDALPILGTSPASLAAAASTNASRMNSSSADRSEEHTSELQSRPHLVCRLLLEKKKKEDHPLLTINTINLSMKDENIVHDK